MPVATLLREKNFKIFKKFSKDMDYIDSYKSIQSLSIHNVTANFIEYLFILQI
jgi:hypothetical protein